jgi:hypothetical protein
MQEKRTVQEEIEHTVKELCSLIQQDTKNGSPNADLVKATAELIQVSKGLIY